MAAAVQVIDEMLKEYLLFRGFTATLKSFDAELKVDKDKSFRVNKIVQQLISFVNLYDLQGIRDYWSYLRRRFFSRLDTAHYLNAQKLEICLYRFYLVNAVQTAKLEKVTEFFEIMAQEIQHQTEWREWFALPFLKNPEQNPSLEMYFSQLWQETFPLSLHNFLNAIFQSMPLPRLLKFNAERLNSEKLRQENSHFNQQILTLQQEIAILQGDKEKKSIPFQSRVTDKPKVIKTKEKDSNFIQRRFRSKSKDQPEKEQKILPGQELEIGLHSGIKQNEQVTLQQQKVEEINNISHENKDFDEIPQVKTEARKSWSDKNESTEKHITDNVKKTENELTEKSENSELLRNIELPAEKSDHFNDPEPKGRRSYSLSSKISPRRSFQRRAFSTDVNNYKEMLEVSSGAGNLSREENASKSFVILSEETFFEHRSPIIQCDFSASGKLVASVDSDGIVKVWKHQPVPSTVATVMSKSAILCTEWASKTDKVLLLGISNGKIRVYDTETKTTRCDMSTDAQFTRIVSLATSPSGTSFVCSATEENRSSVTSVLKHALSTEQEKNIEALGTLLLWDLKTMKLERHLPLGNTITRINCIAYNHNGTLLVTGGADGMIRIYDTRSYDCLMSWLAHVGQINSAQFNVDETSVFSIGRDNMFFQWSLRKMGLKTATLTTHEGMSGPHESLLSGRTKHSLFSRLFTFDCQGEHLLTCSPSSGLIYKYNKNDNTLTQVFSIAEHKSYVTSVDWSTAGDFITCLTGSLTGPIRMTTLLKQ